MLNGVWMFVWMFADRFDNSVGIFYLFSNVALCFYFVCFVIWFVFDCCLALVWWLFTGVDLLLFSWLFNVGFWLDIAVVYVWCVVSCGWWFLLIVLVVMFDSLFVVMICGGYCLFECLSCGCVVFIVYLFGYLVCGLLWLLFVVVCL